MPSSAPCCRRCGACCRAGGPALHRSDLPLLTTGVLVADHLITLRQGEYVTDNVAGGIGPSPDELVKVRPGPDGRTCRFFTTPSACAVHADRPAECRVLFCDAPQGLVAMYREDRLARADILPPDSPLAELSRHHEAQTDLVRLEGLCRLALAGEAGARDRVLETVRFDAAFRELLPARAGVAPETLLFLLGRPLREALPACRAVLGPRGLYNP